MQLTIVTGKIEKKVRKPFLFHNIDFAIASLLDGWVDVLQTLGMIEYIVLRKYSNVTCMCQ